MVNARWMPGCCVIDVGRLVGPRTCGPRLPAPTHACVWPTKARHYVFVYQICETRSVLEMLLEVVVCV